MLSDDEELPVKQKTKQEERGFTQEQADELIRDIDKLQTDFIGIKVKEIARKGTNEVIDSMSLMAGFEDELRQMVGLRLQSGDPTDTEFYVRLLKLVNNPIRLKVIQWYESTGKKLGKDYRTEIMYLIEGHLMEMRILAEHGSIGDEESYSSLEEYHTTNTDLVWRHFHEGRNGLNLLRIAAQNGLLQPNCSPDVLDTILENLRIVHCFIPEQCSNIQTMTRLKPLLKSYHPLAIWRLLGALYREAGVRFTEAHREAWLSSLSTSDQCGYSEILDYLFEIAYRPEVLDLIMTHDPMINYDNKELNSVTHIARWITFCRDNFETAKFILKNGLDRYFARNLQRKVPWNLSIQEIEAAINQMFKDMDYLLSWGLLQESMVPLIRHALKKNLHIRDVYDLGCQYNLIDPDASPKRIINLPALLALRSEKQMEVAAIFRAFNDPTDTEGIPTLLAVIHKFGPDKIKKEWAAGQANYIVIDKERSRNRTNLEKALVLQALLEQEPETTTDAVMKEPTDIEAFQPLLPSCLRLGEGEDILQVARKAKLDQRNLVPFALVSGIIRDSMYEQVTIKIGESQIVKTMFLPELLDTLRAMGRLWDYLEMAQIDDLSTTFEQICLAIHSLSDQTQPHNELLCLVVQNIKAYDFPRDIPALCEAARPVISVHMKPVDQQEILLLVQKLGIYRKIIPQVASPVVMPTMNHKDVYWIFKALTEDNYLYEDENTEKLRSGAWNGYDMSQIIRLTPHMGDNWQEKEPLVKKFETSFTRGRDVFHLYRALNRVNAPYTYTEALESLEITACEDSGVYLADCLMSLDHWRGAAKEKIRLALEHGYIRKGMTAQDLAYALRVLVSN